MGPCGITPVSSMIRRPVRWIRVFIALRRLVPRGWVRWVRVFIALRCLVPRGWVRWVRVFIALRRRFWRGWVRWIRGSSREIGCGFGYPSRCPAGLVRWIRESIAAAAVRQGHAASTRAPRGNPGHPAARRRGRASPDPAAPARHARPAEPARYRRAHRASGPPTPIRRVSPTLLGLVPEEGSGVLQQHHEVHGVRGRRVEAAFQVEIAGILGGGVHEQDPDPYDIGCAERADARIPQKERAKALARLLP